MLWTAVQKYSTMVITFISGIILARLLMPEDYGAIGMLAIFMSLTEVFIDAGYAEILTKMLDRLFCLPFSMKNKLQKWQNH